VTLPFEVSVETPLSAICPYGDTRFRGHRVKMVRRSRKAGDYRQICAKCKRDIVHEREIGAYVTPYMIEEEPF
jgi:hypothetical protein